MYWRLDTVLKREHEKKNSHPIIRITSRTAFSCRVHRGVFLLVGFLYFTMLGWIKLHRSMVDWGWFQKSEMVHLFVYLLLSANNSDGNWMGIVVKKGQLVTGRKTISMATGLSERTIRTCLSRLEETKEITRKSTNKYSIITICNYDSYQSRKSGNDQQTTSKRPANDHKQESKEGYNEKNNIYTFEEFWNDYDKKIDSKKCKVKWAKIPDADKLKIKEFLPKYKESTPDIQYRKNPATFLNNQCWNDQIVYRTTKTEAMPERKIRYVN